MLRAVALLSYCPRKSAGLGPGLSVGVCVAVLIYCMGPFCRTNQRAGLMYGLIWIDQSESRMSYGLTNQSFLFEFHHGLIDQSEFFIWISPWSDWTGIIKKIQEYSRIFRNIQENSGNIKNIRNIQEYSGIFKNIQEFSRNSGIFKNIQEFSRIVRNFQEYLGIFKNIQDH